jgi:hypothetical protein
MLSKLGKFVKFEVGLLLGTIMGAVVATLVSTFIYSAFGYDSGDIFLIKDCLEEEIAERVQLPETK